MKLVIHLLAGASALATMLATGANAQDRSATLLASDNRQQIEVVATAAPACNISSGAAAGSSNASYQSAGASGGTVSITTLADPQTAQAAPASAQIEIPVVCNSAHEVSIRSANGGLLRSGGTFEQISGFAQFLPYRVALDWVGQSRAGQSDTDEPLTVIVPNAGEGLLTVEIAVEGGDAPLVAGIYEDTLQIEITAAS